MESMNTKTGRQWYVIEGECEAHATMPDGVDPTYVAVWTEHRNLDGDMWYVNEVHDGFTLDVLEFWGDDFKRYDNPWQIDPENVPCKGCGALAEWFSNYLTVEHEDDCPFLAWQDAEAGEAGR